MSRVIAGLVSFAIVVWLWCWLWYLQHVPTRTNHRTRWTLGIVTTVNYESLVTRARMSARESQLKAVHARKNMRNAAFGLERDWSALRIIGLIQRN